MLPAILAGAAIAAPVVGGLIGNEQAKGAREDAERARQQALAQYAGISIPEIQKQLLNLQQYQSVGELTPELQQLIDLGPSAMEQISTDPRLRAEQLNALEAMSNMASGNITPADMAGYELARQNAAGELNAQNNAVLQNMQQRGMAGSGAELLAKLKNNQSGAQMLQEAQLKQAQDMQAARMQALQSQATMAGNLRNQDYTEDSNLAKAKDAIAQFNAANAQNVNSANTSIKNNTNAANLTNKQNIANMNTETMNKQQIHNKGLAQDQFNNQMTLANAKSGRYGQQAGEADKRAAQTAAMWSGIGQGVGTGLSSFASGMPSSSTAPTETKATTASNWNFDPNKRNA